MYKLFDYVKIVGGFAKGFKGHIVDHYFDADSGTTKFKVRVYEQREGFTSDILINMEHIQKSDEVSNENV